MGFMVTSFNPDVSDGDDKSSDPSALLQEMVTKLKEYLNTTSYKEASLPIVDKFENYEKAIITKLKTSSMENLFLLPHKNPSLNFL